MTSIEGVPGTPLLMGVMGSQAYGMATEGSDVDLVGVDAAPTERFLDIEPPSARLGTIHTTSDTVDVTMHEAAKFCRLALSSNPAAIELLWLEDYELTTQLGWELVGLRRRLMCQEKVAGAYLGYVGRQFEKLTKQGKFPDVPADRIAKHARHLLRLVEQGTHLWVTGHLVLRVSDAQRVRQFGDRVADGDLDAAGAILFRARYTFEHVKSVLPEAPDVDAARDWLRRVRHTFYTPPYVANPDRV